ncbi:hypothetical protein [Candidatus Viridilinea mediisalina]|nr:hypothetical protein [Candidatus Viridilinea mediisalina]
MRTRAGEWERGDSKPPASRREQMLRYMADTLRLRDEPELFRSYWATIACEWGWAELSQAEQRTFLAYSVGQSHGRPKMSSCVA